MTKAIKSVLKQLEDISIKIIAVNSLVMLVLIFGICWAITLVGCGASEISKSGISLEDLW